MFQRLGPAIIVITSYISTNPAESIASRVAPLFACLFPRYPLTSSILYRHAFRYSLQVLYVAQLKELHPNGLSFEGSCNKLAARACLQDYLIQ
jgi:hypothetical protein